MKKNISVLKTVFITLVSVILSVLLTLQLTYRFAVLEQKKDYEQQLAALSKKFEPKRDEDGNLTLPFKFHEVYNYLESNYVGEFDEEALESELLKFLMHHIGDRYADYFTKEEYEDYTASYSGKGVGIGIRSTFTKDGRAFVVALGKDSPAMKAGLQKGDEIKEINGKNVQKLGSAEAKAEMAGEKGTVVSLKIERNGSSFQVDITRNDMAVPSLDYSMEEGHIGFIRIYTFNRSTPKEFKEAIDTLEKEGAKKLIFDLRENGGGLLNSVHQVVDYLLPDKDGEKDRVIFTSRDAKDNESRYICTDGHQVDLPMAVLLNGHTASASEIFASALHDYDKAILVGEQTFGKGISQSTIRLEDGSAIKLTVAHFYSPKGKCYHEVGITPDVEVKNGGQNIYLTPLNEDPVYQGAKQALI